METLMEYLRRMERGEDGEGRDMRGEKGGMRTGWVYRFAGGGHWHRLSAEPLAQLVPFPFGYAPPVYGHSTPDLTGLAGGSLRTPNSM